MSEASNDGASSSGGHIAVPDDAATRASGTVHVQAAVAAAAARRDDGDEDTSEHRDGLASATEETEAVASAATSDHSERGSTSVARGEADDEDDEEARESGSSDNSADHDDAAGNEEEEEEEELIAVLLCQGCGCPIASGREILPERHERAWRDHVYCYELDLFSNDEAPVWAYSATNPSANRFDLIRVRPDVIASDTAAAAAAQQQSRRGVKTPRTESAAADDVPIEREAGRILLPSPLVSLRGPYSPEFSFFTGYSWCYCSCSNCENFLGWGFLADDKAAAYTAATGRGQEGEEDEEQEEQEGGDAAGADGAPTHTKARTAPPLPTPDFLGVIVTHCTGDDEYPAAQFHAHVAAAPLRARRRATLRRLRRTLFGAVSRMRDGMTAHLLVMAFESEAEGYLRDLPTEQRSSDGDAEEEPGEEPTSPYESLLAIVREAMARRAQELMEDAARQSSPQTAPETGGDERALALVVSNHSDADSGEDSAGNDSVMDDGAPDLGSSSSSSSSFDDGDDDEMTGAEEEGEEDEAGDRSELNHDEEERDGDNADEDDDTH